MSETKTAQVIEWNEDRGFGFLSDESGEERIFLHIRQVVDGCRPPEPGDRVTYTLGADPKGRPQAVQASNLRTTYRLSPANGFAFLLLLILPVVAISRLSFPIAHYWVAAFALIASIVTYIFYARDKRLAVDGEWRISNLRMHVLELIGGWPGAFIAQRRLRHKCSKGRYQFIFWVIVLGHQMVAMDVLLGGEVSYTTWTLLRSFFTDTPQDDLSYFLIQLREV